MSRSRIMPVEAALMALVLELVFASVNARERNIDVVDSFDGAPVRHFNELERRAMDLHVLVNNQCLSGGYQELISTTFSL